MSMSELDNTMNFKLWLINESISNWRSEDGSVGGEIDIGEDYVAIYEWWSNSPGMGDTEKALLELKRHGPIHVVGIGNSPDDPSWKYWVRMREKGLVNTLEDDEGNKI